MNITTIAATTTATAVMAKKRHTNTYKPFWIPKGSKMME
jgi:hypothetical protein